MYHVTLFVKKKPYILISVLKVLSLKLQQCCIGCIENYFISTIDIQFTLHNFIVQKLQLEETVLRSSCITEGYEFMA